MSFIIGRLALAGVAFGLSAQRRDLAERGSRLEADIGYPIARCDCASGARGSGIPPASRLAPAAAGLAG